MQRHRPTQPLWPRPRSARCKRSADKHKVTCPHKIRRAGGKARKPAFLNFVLNDGNDYLIISAAVGLPATISGDAGDDRILGGPSGDTIFGKNGSIHRWA